MSRSTTGEEKDYREESLKIEKRLALTSMLLVAATFIGLALGYFQWSSTRDQLAQMRLDKRAWIYMKATVKEIEADHLRCVFAIKNHGDSTTTVKSGTITTHMLDSYDQADAAFKAHERQAGTSPSDSGDVLLPPGIEVHFTQDMGEIPKGVMGKARDGKSILMVFATEQYELYPGENLLHRTRLCWVFDSKQNELVRYDQYNYAD